MRRRDHGRDDAGRDLVAAPVVLHLGVGPAAIRPTAARAADAAVVLGVPAARRDDLELAVHEVLANAREHGGAADPRAPVRVEVARCHASGAVRVRVVETGSGDRGAWGTGAPPVREASGRGRGLALARACVDEVGVDVGAGRWTVVLTMRP